MELSNARHELFCLEYAKTGNTIDAYLAAGYKSKKNITASRSARKLLELPEIQARLRELHEEIASEKIANAAEIQERLTSILRMEAQEEVIVVEGIEKGVTEARIVMKKPSNADAIKAGQTLARMQGAFDSNLNVTMVVPRIGGESELED